MPGDIIIEYCRFLYNKEYRGHGTAIHYSSSVSYVNLTVANCEYSGNSHAPSVIYFGPSFTSNLHNADIRIQDSIAFIAIEEYPFIFLTKNLTFMERWHLLTTLLKTEAESL